MEGSNFLQLAVCLCLTAGLPLVVGGEARDISVLPEDVRFAAGIYNNFILGQFSDVLNWTTKNLGKSRSEILTKCSIAVKGVDKFCVEVPMPTPWTSSVDLNAPLPDYPRPQLQRSKWLNLNGVWSFKSRGLTQMSESWENVEAQPIIVPFPVEAALSGVNKHDVSNINMLYQKRFTIPDGWDKQHVLLHFDAVDHSTVVYVNDEKIGTHIGGYDRFSFDITKALKKGKNDLRVEVMDPTEFAHIPCGKQRLHPPRHPSSIWYTSTSGIWQTVWLEPVPAAHIERLEIVPDIDDKSISVVAHGSKSASGAPVHAEVIANGNTIATAKGTVGKTLKIDIPEPKLWSPDHPFLYDLEVSIEGDSPSLEASEGEIDGAVISFPGVHPAVVGTTRRRLKGLDGFLDLFFGSRKSQGHKLRSSKKGRDTVLSYFGMRKSSMGRTPDGALRPLLNNEFVFQTGMLDQGFWPDGLYTAPSDEALIWDLEFAKELGYNMLRKHTKVESDRWYYHADRLGVLIWQDMPSMFYQDGSQDLSKTDKENYRLELKNLIKQHHNFPSIVMWVIFNEGWGQHDTIDVVKYAQSLDASRIFDGASGWTDYPIGDVIDMHNYPGPGSPVPTPTRAAVLGEFGGLGRRIEGHMWIPDDAFAYEMHTSAEGLENRFANLMGGVSNLMLDPLFHLSASVYTELVDVEAEINGWATYDRKVKKVDTSVLKKVNQDLIAKSKALNDASNALANVTRSRPVNFKKIKKIKSKATSQKG